MFNVRSFKEVREFQRPIAGVAPKTVRLVVQSHRLSFRVRRFDGDSPLPKRQSRFASRETALGWMERRAGELRDCGFHQVAIDCHAAGMNVAQRFSLPSLGEPNHRPQEGSCERRRGGMPAILSPRL